METKTESWVESGDGGKQADDFLAETTPPHSSVSNTSLQNDGDIIQALPSCPVDDADTQMDTDGPVVGPNGQHCTSSSVLESILQVYTHITSNIFRGGTNGKMPGECMICECRYDPGT